MKRLFSTTIVLMLVVSVNSAVAYDETSNAVKANNAFALALYDELVKEHKNDNIFFSPYSISSALSMAYAGARGNTAREISRALHLFDTGNKAHMGFHDLANAIEDVKSESCRLDVANAMWGQEGYGIRKEFLDLMARYYNSGFKEVDFKNDSEGARKTINDWVSQNTAGKIVDLIGEGGLSEKTRLILTNAIYFKDKWDTPFQSTEIEPFHVGSQKVVNVQMMSINNYNFLFLEDQKRFLYAEPNGKLQILELGYAGGKLSMVILLPRKGSDDFADAINLETLHKWLSMLSSRVVNVYLPKFKFKSKYNLRGILQSMGMYDAYDDGRADFSGITGKKNLCLSEVIHQADIEVNEKGTEAAAATAVGLRKIESLKPEPEEPVTFRADHPFIFLIRHRPTNSILFMGRVMNPSKD